MAPSPFNSPTPTWLGRREQFDGELGPGSRHDVGCIALHRPGALKHFCQDCFALTGEGNPTEPELAALPDQFLLDTNDLAPDRVLDEIGRQAKANRD